MELIKISQTKLKIMLSPEDMKTFELDTTKMCNLSGRAAFRNILKEARERCGFDTAGERVFVQYYPEKNGGCEMFITKLSEALKDKLPTGGGESVCPGRFYHSELTERYDSGYIIYSFAEMKYLLMTCKRLKTAKYSGESRAYKIIDKCRYYLVLSGETYFASENNGIRCAPSFYYVILEHGELICADAVKYLGDLA
ncbi:MAG: adaptor protein MecA [Clostridia bacterium]|nr:adaptor protein MecA [Clostridia bacterium]